MLLNEFLKEHRKGARAESDYCATAKDFQLTIAQEQKEMKAPTASLKEQASQIQRVSDQLKMSKTAPPVVENR